MSGRTGLQYPGAFEGGSDVLSEIDRALAVIGAAHWMEKYRPSPTRSATKHLDQSAALGHFGWSAPPRLGGRCRIVEATLAGTHRNGRDAPIPAIRENHFRTEGLTISGHSPMQPGSSLGLTCERLRTVVPTVNPQPPRGPEG